MRVAVLILSLFLFSCQKEEKTHQTFITDIPTVYDSLRRELDTSVMYKYTQEKVQKLKLNRLQEGIAGIEIRIWDGGGLMANEGLLIFRYQNKTWSATSYAMIVDSVISYRMEHLEPRSGWKSFITRLMHYQIMTLPDAFSVPGIRHLIRGGSGDSGGISVEVATQSMYRFYDFGPFESARCNCWQGENMATPKNKTPPETRGVKGKTFSVLIGDSSWVRGGSRYHVPSPVRGANPLHGDGSCLHPRRDDGSKMKKQSVAQAAKQSRIDISCVAEMILERQYTKLRP